MADLSPERLAQLRGQAARLHTEPHPDDPTRRRFGGPQPGSGRPRVPRPSELAADAAREHWEKIEAALLAGIEEGAAEARSRAADRWLRIALGDATVEQRARAHDRADDIYSRMTDDEVRREAAAMLADAIRTGEITADDLFGGLVVDADVVGIEAQSRAAL